MADDCMIHWEKHQDPSPIWFPSEEHYNKYAFQLSFEQYLGKYTSTKSNKPDKKQQIKECTTQPQTLSQNKQVSTENNAGPNTVVPKNTDSKLTEPEISHRDCSKDAKDHNKSNRLDSNEIFSSMFLQLQWPYPCSTSITKKEQMFYMENFVKYGQQNVRLLYDSSTIRHLEEIDQRIKLEQVQFQDFLKKHAQANPAKYLFLQPGFRFRIKSSLENHVKNIKEKFMQRHYELEKTVSLVSGIAFNSDPVMQHVKSVTDKGRISALKIPKIDSSIDVNQFISFDPFSEHSLQDAQVNEKLYGLSVDNNIDVVVSSLSLITLVNNQSPEFSKVWKMPIEIKNIKSGNAKSSKKVVIIGNPLPPNALSTRDANHICYHKALKDMMQDQTITANFQFNDDVLQKVQGGIIDLKNCDAAQGKVRPNEDDHQVPEDVYKICVAGIGGQMLDGGINTQPVTNKTDRQAPKNGADLDKFGTITCTDEVNQSSVTVKGSEICGKLALKSNLGENSTGDSSIDIPIKDLGATEFSAKSDIVKAVGNGKGPGFQSSPEGIQENKSDIRGKKQEDRIPISKNKGPIPEDQDVTSNARLDIWKLGKISLLVKTTCDGYAVGPEIDEKENTNIIYKIFPKTEYKSNFGVEEFSVSELTNAWWDTHLCQGSHLLCIRVDARSNKIIRIDDYHCSNLVGPHCPFKPKVSMKLLHNILKDMTRQDEGEYLLTHNHGDMHACLYKGKQTERQQSKVSSGYMPTRDFDSNSEDWPVMDDNLSWLPIDTNVVLPIFMENGRVPCLFPLQEELGVPEVDKSVNNAGKNKRKGKAKRKKNAKMKKHT